MESRWRLRVLHHSLKVVLPDVPFLCHFRRATDLVDTKPYAEITEYLAAHRDASDDVFRTLSYFDGMNFASRATARAAFSVGLADTTCPPSTVYAAFNHYAGPKEIVVYRYNNHEGGGPAQRDLQVKLLREELLLIYELWQCLVPASAQRHKPTDQPDQPRRLHTAIIVCFQLPLSSLRWLRVGLPGVVPVCIRVRRSLDRVGRCQRLEISQSMR